MRMAGPDIVLFVVGAALFGGATYAIVNMGGGLGSAGSALGQFTVQYDAAAVEVGSEPAPSLRSATATFDVNESDVVSIVVDVACTGATGDVGPVSFNLAVSVEGPNGLTGQGTGTCGGGASVQIEVAALPGDTSAPGSTEDDARANLAAGPNATRGAGEWTVTVSGNRGTPSPVPLPAGDPGGTITLTANVARPRFTPLQK